MVTIYSGETATLNQELQDVSDKERTSSVPAQQGKDGISTERSSTSDVQAFLEKVKAMPAATTSKPGQRGRLIFAMDATMSRQPTWDLALGLQAAMFQAVSRIGGLDVQLIYFRGFTECRASKWVHQPEALARLMTTVSCRGGHTQIGKVLSHARKETARERVGALVFVGDAMEERIDDLAQKAGELGVLGVPMFLFQEGHDPAASTAFAELARLTGGAHCRFDQGSADQLRELLSAVAVYASGGRAALADLSKSKAGTGARLLLEQLK